MLFKVLRSVPNVNRSAFSLSCFACKLTGWLYKEESVVAITVLGLDGIPGNPDGIPD